MHTPIWARVILVVVVLVVACGLTAAGHDLTTALLLATALLGMAADTARRALPAQPARTEGIA
ncbi:hypothetical protein [Halostreptopolyspora alba]|uniref:Uncharacterized protein n=1 Tax=Halostreptopolyspora alba TaxID=2487137 RepID=A0A3N0DYL1_9ACTN|nr:hypothetical protein EFW17_22445 [Nocardiopsaceae bacterium YIM 96095]